MRRFHLIFVSLILFIGLFPSVSFAFSDEELASFLKEEGLTEEQLNDHLSYYYDMTIKDFETIEELDEFLGEKITDENLQQLLTDYGIASEEELVSLLVENGEMEKGENVRDVFIYIDALDVTVSFYTGTPITDESLQQLLDDYGLTLDELNKILAENDDSLDNYKSIEDLEAAIMNYGIPISDQSLQQLLDDYGLTRDELNALLAKYDDSLENYDNIDDLYLMVGLYKGIEESDGFVEDLGIGLTKEELVNLIKHLRTIDFTDPAFEAKMNEISNRLTAFGDFESAAELTEEQISELVNIYDDVMNLFNMEAKYYLVKGNEKKPLSEQDLIKLKSTNGYDLAIELYSKQGPLLADILLTSDLFGSEIIEGTIGQVEEEVKQVEQIVQKQPENKEKTESKQDPKSKKKPHDKKQLKNKQPRTVKGGKLPNTAGNYTEGILAGLALILAGAVLFRKWNVKRS